MDSITHPQIGDDTRGEMLAEGDINGWHNVILVRGSKRTYFFGLQDVPADTVEQTRRLYRSCFFDKDTRGADGTDLAREISSALGDAAFDQNYVLAPIEALGAEAKTVRSGWLSREADDIPLYRSEDGARNQEGWSGLTAPGVACPDRTLQYCYLMAEGGIIEDGRLRLDAGRAEALAPAIEAFPIFWNVPEDNREALARDIERGNDVAASIARNTGHTRATVMATSAAHLAACGITDMSGDDAWHAIGHMSKVPKGRIPQTPEEMEGMLATIRLAAKIRDHGLRADAAEGFLTEACEDWTGAARQIRAAGRVTVTENVWEAIKAVSPGAKPAKRDLQQMSLAPHLTLKEVTHICRSQNEDHLDARFTTGSLPKILPEKTEFRGGSLHEVLHDRAFSTFDIYENDRKTKTYWRDLSEEMCRGEVFVLGVKDSDGAPIGVVVAHGETGVRESLQSHRAQRASDAALMIAAAQHVDREIVAKHPEWAMERKAICAAEEVKTHAGHFQEQSEARKRSLGDGTPAHWHLAKPYIPAVLRRMGPDGLASHYEAGRSADHAQIERSPGKREGNESQKKFGLTR